MTKVVRLHVPASQVPPEFRGDIDPACTVTVTVGREAPVLHDRPSFREMIERLHEKVAVRHTTPEEAVRRIRKLRDEWDD